MTRHRANSFTVPAGIVVPWAGDVLVQLAAPYVPILLHRTEVFKHSFVYEDDAGEAAGLDSVNAQQEAFLMDATERIISEVRALRDGELTDSADRDPELDPYTLSLTSLRTLADRAEAIGLAVSDGESTVLEELRLIREALAEGGGEGIIERLDTLIFLLGAI